MSRCLRKGGALGGERQAGLMLAEDRREGVVFRVEGTGMWAHLRASCALSGASRLSASASCLFKARMAFSRNSAHAREGAAGEGARWGLGGEAEFATGGDTEHLIRVTYSEWLLTPPLWHISLVRRR